MAGKLLKSSYINGMKDKNIEDIYLNLFNFGESLLNTNTDLYNMSDYSLRGLISIDLENVRSSRYKNYIYIKDLFEKHSLSVKLFNIEADKKSSPFVFPIKVCKELRNELRTELVELRAYCPILWPMSPVVSPEKFRKTKELSDSILCLPVDQRYSPEHMEELFSRFKKVLVNK